jgi:hypothetical protein
MLQHDRFEVRVPDPARTLRAEEPILEGRYWTVDEVKGSQA